MQMSTISKKEIIRLINNNLENISLSILYFPTARVLKRIVH